MGSLSLAWKAKMAGMSAAGLVMAEGRIVVADSDSKNDYYRCFDLQTGRPLWCHQYPNTHDIDFGNAPRAAPLVFKGKVYCLGAAGDLACLALDDGP